MATIAVSNSPIDGPTRGWQEKYIYQPAKIQVRLALAKLPPARYARPPPQPQLQLGHFMSGSLALTRDGPFGGGNACRGQMLLLLLATDKLLRIGRTHGVLVLPRRWRTRRGVGWARRGQREPLPMKMPSTEVTHLQRHSSD